MCIDECCVLWINRRERRDPFDRNTMSAVTQTIYDSIPAEYTVVLQKASIFLPVVGILKKLCRIQKFVFMSQNIKKYRNNKKIFHSFVPLKPLYFSV